MRTNEGAAPAARGAIRLLCAVAVACGACTAWGQTLYRCGSSFQDHPCAGGQAGVALGTNAARAGVAASAPSVRCTQRGVAAQKISWAREAGRTELEQASAQPDKRDLIAEVYGRRGSSVEVRAAIEADCVAQEARTGRTGELAAAGNGSPGMPADPVDLPAASIAAAPANRPDNARAGDADRKAAVCKGLDAERESILARQRGRNTQAAMEQLRQQYRDVDDRRRHAGC